MKVHLPHLLVLAPEAVLVLVRFPNHYFCQVSWGTWLCWYIHLHCIGSSNANQRLQTSIVTEHIESINKCSINVLVKLRPTFKVIHFRCPPGFHCFFFPCRLLHRTSAFSVRKSGGLDTSSAFVPQLIRFRRAECEPRYECKTECFDKKICQIRFEDSLFRLIFCLVIGSSIFQF